MSSDHFHSLSRRSLLIVGLGMLAGCGFAPVYGTGGSAEGLRGTIAYIMPDTALGYHMRNRFEERLGLTDTPHYQLAVTLETRESVIAIGSDNAPSRVNLLGTANYVLSDREDQAVISGTVTSFTSFSTTGTTVATRAAERDAATRLVVTLADLVVTRILSDPPAAPQ
ncbi:MAG: hypothetical protein JJ872_01325 [Marivivens sp.]|nr:hypothetical protein [Marivivens sp.]